MLNFQVALEIAGIIFVSMWPQEENKCDAYFILIYLHCAYWLLIMLVDHILKVKHHHLRISGYLDFYQSTYQHIRAPFFVASLWTTAYLLLAAVLHHTHKMDYEKYCRASEWFTPINYILFLTTLELSIIVPIYVNYISKHWIEKFFFVFIQISLLLAFFLPLTLRSYLIPIFRTCQTIQSLETAAWRHSRGMALLFYSGLLCRRWRGRLPKKGLQLGRITWKTSWSYTIFTRSQCQTES